MAAVRGRGPWESQQHHDTSPRTAAEHRHQSSLVQLPVSRGTGYSLSLPPSPRSRMIMAPATTRPTVLVTTAQRQELQSMLRRTTLAAGPARRARAILLLADGHSVSAV